MTLLSKLKNFFPQLLQRQLGDAGDGSASKESLSLFFANLNLNHPIPSAKATYALSVVDLAFSEESESSLSLWSEEVVEKVCRFSEFSPEESSFRECSLLSSSSGLLTKELLLRVGEEG